MIPEFEMKFLRIGFKQVMRIIGDSNASKVYLASDCEDKIKLPIENAASEKNLDIYYVDTMSELGRMCGIDVGASCAAVAIL